MALVTALAVAPVGGRPAIAGHRQDDPYCTRSAPHPCNERIWDLLLFPRQGPYPYHHPRLPAGVRGMDHGVG